MPSAAVDSAIRAGYGREHKSASTRLHHVKQGKIASLSDLVALIRYSMPTYVISAHLLSTEDLKLALSATSTGPRRRAARRLAAASSASRSASARSSTSLPWRPTGSVRRASASSLITPGALAPCLMPLASYACSTPGRGRPPPSSRLKKCAASKKLGCCCSSACATPMPACFWRACHTRPARFYP